MSSTIEGWKYAFLDLLAPPVCAGCGVMGVPICIACLSQIEIIKNPVCKICASPAGREALCEACTLFAPDFKQARSFARYARPFREVVMALKHRGDRSLGHWVAQAAAPFLQNLEWPVQIGLPVPLGLERERMRGYNQVDLFAAPLCAELSLPFRRRGLVRSQETRSQVGLSREERRYNLQRAFWADPTVVSEKNVLLFDDVFTTGTTANECAGALLRAGSQAVYVFTLARASA